MTPQTATYHKSTTLHEEINNNYSFNIYFCRVKINSINKSTPIDKCLLLEVVAVVGAAVGVGVVIYVFFF